VHTKKCFIILILNFLCCLGEERRRRNAVDKTVVQRNMNSDMIHQWLPERRAQKNKLNAIVRDNHIARTYIYIYFFNSYTILTHFWINMMTFFLYSLDNAESRLANNQARWAEQLQRKSVQYSFFQSS